MSSSQSENSSIIQGQNGPYQNSDDRTSGVGSLVPSPVVREREREEGRETELFPSSRSGVRNEYSAEAFVQHRLITIE